MVIDHYIHVTFFWVSISKTWISFSYNAGSSDGGADASYLLALGSGSNCIITEVTVDVFDVKTFVPSLRTLINYYSKLYVKSCKLDNVKNIH